MADKLSYNQILENKKFIDDLLSNQELNIDDKEELEYVWQSLVCREESKFDAIIILTDHDNVNYNLIKENAKMIFDSRGIYQVNKRIIRV